ncbi:MAG: T9SS type A sorting domain-containing protein [Ignavibacteria bacterium]|nr:T9SS type A sorting domain-containing protein [Ignavibacteria bacterium]
MLGLLKSGEPIDPCDDALWSAVFGGIPCETIDPLFWFSGDPESQYGWLNTFPVDQRMFVNTGPFSLEIDKPITIIIGYTIGDGLVPVNSVTVGKEVSKFVQQFYQSNFDYNILPVEEEHSIIADDFKLYQNFPNPFNPSTKIKFTIPTSSLPTGQAGLNPSPYQGEGHRERLITLKVFDVLGSEVANIVNEEKPAGSYEIMFDATTFPSGVYFYQLRAGNFVETKKMVLVK